MNPADQLLPLLNGAKRTGPQRWIARCPAHDDKRPSLSIRETDDGMLLLHCWAGCDASQVVGAVGLDLVDLFPQRDSLPGGGRKPERRPWTAADLLLLAAHEAGVALIVVGDTVAGKVVSETDLHRLAEAGGRLADMVEATLARR
jgi:hypothetical protein